MRRIEEKKTIRLQIGTLILLIFSTAGIQFADSRINDFNNSLLLELMSASLKMQNSTFQRMTAEFAVFKQLLPFDEVKAEVMEENKARILSNFKRLPYQDPEVIALHRKLENGEIDLKEYYAESVQISERKAAEELAEFNRKARAISKQFADGTIWTIIKKILLFLQIMFIAYLAYGYFDILRSISSRDKKQLGKIPKQK